MENGWTPARRRRQSLLIRTWKPWDHSTGPRSAAGQDRASLNARKHGGRAAQSIAELATLRKLLRELRQAERDVL